MWYRLASLLYFNCSSNSVGSNKLHLELGDTLCSRKMESVIDQPGFCLNIVCNDRESTLHKWTRPSPTDADRRPYEPLSLRLQFHIFPGILITLALLHLPPKIAILIVIIRPRSNKRRKYKDLG